MCLDGWPVNLTFQGGGECDEQVPITNLHCKIKSSVKITDYKIAITSSYQSKKKGGVVR